MPPVSSVPGSSSTTGTTDATHTRQLPPLRTVLGPQLDLPTPIHDSGDPWHPRTSTTPSSTFGLDGVSHSTPRSPSTSAAQPVIPFPTNFSATDADADTLLPPLSLPNTRTRHPGLHSAPLFISSIHPPSPDLASRIIHSTVPQPPYSAPPHSAQHVLRPSPSGELITGPSIPRSRTRAGTTAAAAGASGSSAASAFSTAELRAQWERRHICPLCKKRFNRPSSLKTHQSVHTGSRPYACPHPGCTKTFSVASNMRRHLRKHGQTSKLEQTTLASEPAPELEDELNHPHSSSREPDSGSLGSSEGSGEGEVDVDEDTYDAVASGGGGGITQTPTLYMHAPTSTLRSPVTSESARRHVLPAALLSAFPRPPTGTSQNYFEWRTPAVAGHNYDDRHDTTLGTGSRASSESAPASDVPGPGDTQRRP